MSQTAAGMEIPLADLPVGMKAVVVGLADQLRNRKKFADAGMVAGVELRMESHAPLGGLLRIKVLDSSITLHRNDGQHILVKCC